MQLLAIFSPHYLDTRNTAQLSRVMRLVLTDQGLPRVLPDNWAQVSLASSGAYYGVIAAIALR